MDREEIQRTAEQLVSTIESGATAPLNDVLNGLPPEERLALARAMDKINFDHRLANRHLPDIQIGVGSSNGQSVLIDMQIKTGKTSKDVFDQKKETDRDLFPGATAYARNSDCLEVFGFPDGKMIVAYPYPDPTLLTTSTRRPADVSYTARVNGVHVTKYKDGTVIRLDQAQPTK